MPKTTEQIRKPLEDNSDYRLAELYWKKKWWPEEEVKELFARLEEELGCLLDHNCDEEMIGCQLAIVEDAVQEIKSDFLGGQDGK